MLIEEFKVVKNYIHNVQVVYAQSILLTVLFMLCFIVIADNKTNEK